MRIVKVDQTNIGVLYQLNAQLAFDEEQAELFSVSETDYTTGFLADNPIMYGYLLYANDEAVGFYLYHYKFATYIGSKVLYIEDIYLTDEYATTENKRLLLQHAIAISREKHCCRVEMRMLKAFNIGYEFIQANGFNVVDKWEVYRLNNLLNV